jgi:hypothetical protein
MRLRSGLLRQGMKLKACCVGDERATREPRPFDRPFAFFDVLLCGPALIVERDDVLRAPQQVRHDEADAWEELTRVPLSFGYDATRLRPTSRLIAEGRVQSLHVMRRSSDGSFEEVSDSFCNI